MNKKLKIAIGVVVAVVIAGGVYIKVTENPRKYNAAVEAYNNGDYQDALDKFTSLEDYKDSSTMKDKAAFEVSADGRFLKAIKKGLTDRWAKIDEHNNEENPNYYKEYCEVELQNIGAFSDESFNDQTLGDLAKRYIQNIHDAEDALQDYDLDYSAFYTKWSAARMERGLVLEDLVNNYNLTGDDEFNTEVKEIIADAKSLQKQKELDDAIIDMMNQFTIEKTQDAWSMEVYKLHMKNTTHRTFGNFYVTINLLDENGKIVGDGSSGGVNHWTPGQEADTDLWVDGGLDPNNYTVQYTAEYTLED